MNFTRPLLIAGLATLVTFSTAPARAAVLYDLSTVALDGQPGENTYSLGQGNLTQGSGNSLTFANSVSGFSYFAGYFNPATLVNIGDQIVLTFTATYTNFTTADSQAFRFGLFNSSSARVTANSTSTDSATFNNYTGYRADYNPSNSGNTTASLLRERKVTSTNLFSTGSSPGLSSTPSTLPMLALSGSPFSGTFTIEKTSTGVTMTTQVNGTTSVTAMDNASAFTTFDTIGFFTIGTGGVNATSLILTDLQVAAVPEPSTVGLALLAGGMVVCLQRRRASRNR